MTNRYVNSAGAVNGWAAGSSGNDGLDPSTPYALWSEVHVDMVEGDVLYFNSVGTSEYTIPGGSSTITLTEMLRVGIFDGTNYMFGDIKVVVADDSFEISHSSVSIP